MELKFISYDGKYPSLCMGTLIFELNGTRYENKYCLSSKGSTYFDSDWNAHITSGSWTVDNFANFTDEEMKAITEMVNDYVDEGCCGGCL